ncbi:endospore germination permease [Paenibacillus chartarius]|uniref:Endospore germination permease n=1 Tax=Paenibacillus chartarius TaxID=747481 RepID=A0ABV6DFW1_9BACL
MDKFQISIPQAMMLAISSITVTGHLLFIPVILNHSGRDSWLSLLLVLVPAALTAYVTAALAQKFPGCSVVEYAELAVGKWLGKLFAAVAIFYFFHDITISIRGFGEFFTSSVTPRTPILVFMTLIVLLAVYAARGGIETVARTNQVFLMCMIPIGVLASVLTHKDKDYLNFLPMLEHGIPPVLMGTLSLLSLYSTFFVMSMVFPHVSESGRKRLKWYSVLTILILIIMFLGPVTGPIAIFGEELSQGLSFPSFQILRDIKVGQLQRLDFIGILLWSLGSFAKISLFLYAACSGTAKLFGLNDYRSLTTPTGVLLIIVALYNNDSYVELYDFLMDVYPFYSTLIGMGLPCLLMIAAVWRGRMRGGAGGST